MSKDNRSTITQLIVLITILIALLLAMKFLPVGEWLTSFEPLGRTNGSGRHLHFHCCLRCSHSIARAGIGPDHRGRIRIRALEKDLLPFLAGSTLGAALAFLVARFIARDKIERMAQANEKFRRIDNAIGKQGAKLILLLRLSPIIPFNLSNYFYGLTAVKFWPYVVASWIGMMPGTFLYVYIGTAGKAAASATAGGRAMQHGWKYWTFMGVGFIATIVVTIWVTRIARNALGKTELT